MLSRRISVISKFLLLSNLAWASPKLVSTDRFLFRIIDKTVSHYDLRFQERNLKALDCLYDDSYIIQYFHKSLIKDLTSFLKDFPEGDEAASAYMHKHEQTLKNLRLFYKVYRYSEDQKVVISPKLEDLIKKVAKENKCDSEVLYGEGLKTNFQSLLRMELYFRSRYQSQIKGSKVTFDTVRPSIDLFVESLDKQFSHEYYW